MKFKYLFVLFVPFLLASCKKDNSGDLDQQETTNPGTNPPVTNPPAPATYNITEDFENGTKGGYAAADVTINTGSWNFNDALIGNLAADLKNGTKSVRLRTGSLTMNFDVQGLNTLYIKHGKYGSDANFTWQLLMSTDGGTTYTQVGADINETNTTLALDSFKVTSPTGKVRFQIKKASATVRLNIDDITFKGIGESGIIVGGSDTDPNEGGSTGGTAAPARGVDITGADVPPTAGDNSNLLFGNPSGASSVTVENFLIDAGYYTESYSKTRGTPNWVSWHLDATNTTRVTDRLNNFAAFSGLPADFYKVESNSYSGSGFDRGHNCPSADRTSSTAANGATFLMTNMIPQAPNNNQQTWNNLEGALRAEVTAGNEVYIIMGSYGKGGVGSLNTTTVETINNGNVTVPSNVWKVAIVIPAGNGDLLRAQNLSQVKVVAINTPNRNNVSSDWRTYQTSVRDIEAKVTTATGTAFNLFSNLPQSVQDVLETRATAGI